MCANQFNKQDFREEDPNACTTEADWKIGSVIQGIGCYVGFRSFLDIVTQK